MKIINNDDVPVVGTIRREADGTIAVRILPFNDMPEKYRVFIDNKLVFGDPQPVVIDDEEGLEDEDF